MYAMILLMVTLNTHRGFSLVELIIVVVVLAILASITFVSYGLIQENALNATTKTSVKQLEGVVRTESLKNKGLAPVSLAFMDTLPSPPVLPEGYTSEYMTFDTFSEYCIALVPPTGSKGKPFFMSTFMSTEPKEGKCSSPISAAEGFLGYSDVKGTNASFNQTSPYGNLTMYAAFEISNMDGAWSSMASGVRASGSHGLQLDQNSAGSNALRFRADTTQAVNYTLAQGGVRTNGKHVGWVQVRNNTTELGFAYDSATEYAKRSLLAGDGMPFVGVRLQTASTGMNPLGAIMYNKAHSKEERSRVLQWLAKTHGVPGIF